MAQALGYEDTAALSRDGAWSYTVHYLPRGTHGVTAQLLSRDGAVLAEAAGSIVVDTDAPRPTGQSWRKRSRTRKKAELDGMTEASLEVYQARWTRRSGLKGQADQQMLDAAADAGCGGERPGAGRSPSGGDTAVTTARKKALRELQELYESMDPAGACACRKARLEQALSDGERGRPDRGGQVEGQRRPEAARTALEAAVCPSDAFTDVGRNAWYHDAVDMMLERGYMEGVGAGRFDADGTLSRAQLVTILHRMAGSPRRRAGRSPLPTWRPASGTPTRWPGRRRTAWSPATAEAASGRRARSPGSRSRSSSTAIPARSSPGRRRAGAVHGRGEVSGYAADAMCWAVGLGLISGGAGADGRSA